tara:strand:- start:33445 stop:33744 length:300 start_codon:yes stop_codon:yes gene_type:complete
MLLWNSSLIGCEKISPTIQKLNGYSVGQIRVLWEACAMSTRRIIPNISPILVQLGCDCSTNYTIRTWKLKELNNLHLSAKKMKEYKTLIRLNCNEYRGM